MQPKRLKSMYNNVLCQTISSDKAFLFAGNTFGDIFVKGIYHLKAFTNSSTNENVYYQGSVSIECLCFHNDFLIVGTQGLIYGLKWDNDAKTLSNSKSWEILIPNSPCVNCFFMDKQTDKLLVGCDDGAIHWADLTKLAIVGNFKEHKNAVYCITGSYDTIYSGGIDGELLMWSIEGNKSFDKIEPYKMDNVGRPEFGNFIGCCDVSNDWLICGGGPRLILWSLRSNELVHVYDFPGKIFCAKFFDDTTALFVGGVHNYVNVYHLNGNKLSSLFTDNTATWSAAHDKKTDFLSFAGYSNQLSIITDYRIVSSQINVYEDDQNRII